MRDAIWLQKSLTLSVQNDHLLQDDLNFKLNSQVFNEQISARISFGQTGKKVFFKKSLCYGSGDGHFVIYA